MKKRKHDEDLQRDFLIITICIISIAWSLYCRLRVIELVCRRGG